ncbi:CPBP family intramembrane glutamic endopeptidase [Tessaracoccus palaemonis]|uniref:CPBP family intramembrane metalloprotease n=1 Tax=Tessaracoccus palaemonis TaxID=2829499 RepID=A0ABX8SJN2_9ACTN|nr:CPBP family intramembrane glutamic endopeptidase [Tessaracoccus palaemonis]QXT63174.1 CPBP family intramembrane metalloprotease [Tessaracoccus palaemonis]
MTASPEQVQDINTGRDFPFYSGVPVLIKGGGWLIVAAACLVSFLVLILLPVPGMVGMWVRAILFPVIPLVALAFVAPKGWTAIFRRVRVRDVGAMFLFAIINIAVSFAVAAPLKDALGAEANPAGGILAGLDMPGRVSFYLATAPQLLGEELVTILPFLALLYVFVAKFNWPRWVAVLVSWLATALIFGALHLPTYDWNFLQCFLIIGSARLILSLAFLVTKNVWVSAGAHIINDWVLFTIPLALAGASLIS